MKIITSIGTLLISKAYIYVSWLQFIRNIVMLYIYKIPFAIFPIKSLTD
jgi:hypothetical protein